MKNIKQIIIWALRSFVIIALFLQFSAFAQQDIHFKADTFSVIHEWINEVDTGLVIDHIKYLQDFQTRDCFTQNAVDAQNWIKSQFELLGLTVELQDFPLYNDNPSDNVIATLTGQVFPQEFVVIGGHYDSWTSSFQAPGADDNASGTSGVLEVARVLSQYKFKRSIIFCAFSAEEYGLVGSNAFAGRCQNQGMNLLGYFNMDMIGYHEPGTLLHSDMLNPPSAQPLADFYIDVAAIYLPDFIIEEGAFDGGNSDHATFNNWGYQGIFPFEDDEYYSPFIHTTNDLVGPSFNSPELAKNLIQGGLAAVATLAIPFDPVGNNEISSKPVIEQVFPNPAHDFVTFRSGSSETTRFELFSMQGKVLLTGSFKNLFTLDITGFKKGAYVLKFTGQDVVETRRLIIE